MPQLNTIFSLEKVLKTNSDLNVEESGILNIKYSGTKSSTKTNAVLRGLITREGDYLLIELIVNYVASSECSRCLKSSTYDRETFINEKLYIKNQNDYEINFKDENIDIYPIISEKIIDNISLVTLCDDNCNGLCVVCGKEQNTSFCKHEEKNLKESPFSSLSELDL